jgi:hypothetical protein
MTALATAAIAIGTSTAAQADTVSGDGFFVSPVHSGQDCPGTGGAGSGFDACWATTGGVVYSVPNDPNASLSVAKVGPNGIQDVSGNYTTITADDLQVSLEANNTLLFTYLMDPDDPILHYITIMQADSYALFYDAAGFTSGTTYSFNLTTYFPNNPGFSHLTVYDETGAVPEPATWAMMLVGFAGIGMAIRRSRKRNSALLQIA